MISSVGDVDQLAEDLPALEGVFRWRNRVLGYAFALITDRYPPFRLGP